MDEQFKYKIKYNKLKRYAKNKLYENAAICDLITKVNEKTKIVEQENKFLLLKLYQHEPALTNQQMKAPKKEIKINSNKKKPVQSQNSQKLVVNKQKCFSIKQIPLDQLGRPTLPILLGSLTIHSLGSVIYESDHFHSENVIYPLGFITTRIYGNINNPEQQCVYICKIKSNDSNNKPKFEISANINILKSPIVGNTTDQCHKELLRIINVSSNEKNALQPKGDLFFGISNPIVQNLIQRMPNAKKCQNYKWIKFETDGGIIDSNYTDSENPAINFESLKNLITFNKYNSSIDIKTEPSENNSDFFM